MANRGKSLIIGLFIVAFIAAGYAWWHTYHQGTRVLGWWGNEAAYRIRLADDCTLYALGPPSLSNPNGLTAITPSAERRAEQLKLAGQTHPVVDQKQIAGLPGFVHARQALIQDASFQWQAASGAPGTDTRTGLPGDVSGQSFPFALRFVDAEGQTTLAFDLEHRLLFHQEASKSVQLEPTIVDGLRTYFSEQFPDTLRPTQATDN